MLSNSTRNRFGEAFSVDLRSLAVFRICVACVLLFDVFDRWPDLVALYTDLGVLPAELLRSTRGFGAVFSIHYHASASVWAQAALFFLAAVTGVALLAGYRTRAATVLSWYLLVSLQVRNPWAAFEGADKYLRMLLFWGMFLPLGARFSLDRARGRVQEGLSDRLLCVPGVALLIQIALLYWVTGLKKSGATWLDGRALYYALNIEYWATGLAPWLLEQSGLLPLLTWATRWTEILGPFFAFSPVWSGPLRVATILAFFALHVGMGLFLSIGMFPAVCIAAWTAMLPTWFWDQLLPRLRRQPVAASAADDAPRWRPALATQVAAGLALVWLLLFLLPQVRVGGFRVPVSMPDPVIAIGRALRLNQTWGMFAPDPSPMDFWPVVDGELANGTSVDPFRDAPVSWEKPERIPDTLPSFKWRLYYWVLLTTPPSHALYEPSYEGLARYFCRDWNSRHEGGERLVAMQLGFMAERTLDDSIVSPRRTIAYRHRC